MSVGKRISLLRKKERLTQEQLADIIGATRQAISKWESEKSSPDIDYVIRICSHFQVSTDYLLLGIDHSAIPSNNSESSEMEDQKNGFSQYLFLFCGITVLCGLILILLPLFASMYQIHMSNIGPYFTDPNQYLEEWPLWAIKWIAIIGVISGFSGVVWIIYKKEHQ